jgi:hypothetical protein
MTTFMPIEGLRPLPAELGRQTMNTRRLHHT